MSRSGLIFLIFAAETILASPAGRRPDRSQTYLVQAGAPLAPQAQTAGAFFSGAYVPKRFPRA